jgi:hypothetical protein
MYLCPTLYALPLSRRPGVFVPTMVARLFSSAKAETISPAFAVCSFTQSTTMESSLAESFGDHEDRFFNEGMAGCQPYESRLVGRNPSESDQFLRGDNRARDVSRVRL